MTTIFKRLLQRRIRTYSLASLLSVMMLSASIVFAQSPPTLVTPIVTAVQIGQPYYGLVLIGGTPAPTTVTFSNVPPGLTATHLGGGKVQLTGTPTGAARTANMLVTATNTAGTANLVLLQSSYLSGLPCRVIWSQSASARHIPVWL
jgi:hypothetical protein